MARSPLSDEAALFRRIAATKPVAAAVTAERIAAKQAAQMAKALKPRKVAPVATVGGERAPATVLPFAAVSHCPKCGEERRRAYRNWRRLEGIEWIEYKCRCGFAWNEETSEGRDERLDLL